jgi:hypothetical protein
VPTAIGLPGGRHDGFLQAGLIGEAEELITGQLGERIGSNDDETVPA